MNENRFPVSDDNKKLIEEAAKQVGYEVLGVRGNLVGSGQDDKLEIAVKNTRNGLEGIVEYDDTNAMPFSAGEQRFSNLHSTLGYISENIDRFTSEAIEDSFNEKSKQRFVEEQRSFDKLNAEAKERYNKEREKHDGQKILSSIMTENELKQGFYFRG